MGGNWMIRLLSDLRAIIGLFFFIVGSVLVLMGLIFPDHHAPMSTAAVNIWVGLLFLAFGGVMLCLALRARTC